ncbi:MAG: hypothetical protein V1493_06350 [Candidatus Diapherotrites archaeon]
MDFEWFAKERLTNKVAIISAISGILFFIASLVLTPLFFLAGFWLPESTLPLTLFALWTLLGLCVYLLGFAGLICGVIGLVRDFKAKKKPSKIAGLAMVVNLIMALLLLGIAATTLINTD